jgi:hypothetical protein
MGSMQMLQGACGACPAGSAIAVARALVGRWEIFGEFGVVLIETSNNILLLRMGNGMRSSCFGDSISSNCLMCDDFFGLVGI